MLEKNQTAPEFSSKNQNNEIVEYTINIAAEGSWFGWYSNNGLMVLPAAAMFIIGVLIWIQRSYNEKLVDIS